ncbi:hypothetical protein O4H52_07330 [Sphingomonadaceae bacterium G21617-S1]|jgi:hypothetical protein|uniref:hypothetical protein n=1 Tax=Rhizorhabdus sp. TaxID=1968843 RepID=UPI0022C914D9|nr:hypothetical protein [Sphingomonadaceae bacterium G21617-S1]
MAWLAWLGVLVVGMFALSLATTTTIHAREISATTTIECSGLVHYEGDADQSPPDSDKTVPHHHGGCHGQFVGLPATLPLGAKPVSADMPSIVAIVSALPSYRAGPPLRPPAA